MKNIEEVENMNNTTGSKIKSIIKQLRRDENSFLSRLEKTQIPENDEQYMHLWRNYYKVYTLKDLQAEHLLNRYAIQLSDLEKLGVFNELKLELKKIADKQVNKLLDLISVEPRIDGYLKQLKGQNKIELRKLLLYVLSCYEDLGNISRTFTLDEVIEAIDLDFNWLINLSHEHQCFKDGILLYSERHLDHSRPFYQSELRICPNLQKFFWGSQLTDQEWVNLKSMSIPHLFGIEPDFNKVEELELQLDANEKNGELPDIDQVFDELQQQRKSSEIKKIDVGNNSAFLEADDTFDNDRDYLELESEWILDQMKLKDTTGKRYLSNEENSEVLKNRIARKKKECEIKIAKAKENGFVPALVYYQKRYHLNEDELNILKLLVIISWSSFFNLDDLLFTLGIKIKDIINTLFESINEKFNAQKYFQQDSALVKAGLIHVEQQGLDESILDSQVAIDNILLHYLVGKDFNLDQLMPGGKVYTPKETLDDLEKNDKEDMRMSFINQPKVKKAKEKLDLPTLIKKSETRFYLFVGPPGTGKTLAANAMASELDKNILTVNLNILQDVMGMLNKNESVFSILFREAANKNAILFFDESEQLLMNRMNDLLIYSNTFDVTVIFATNAEFKIDDALRDRIGANITYFKNPGPESRFKILTKHLPLNIDVPSEKELRKLALQIKLNGRQIKNMVNAAISYAVEDQQGEAIQRLGIEHLQRAAKDQRKSKVFNSNLETSVIPRKGLDEGIFDEKNLIELHGLANFYNARKVLQNEWGFSDERDLSSGNVVLFHGPSGVGKTLAAEMIAFEIGKNLRVVNYAQIMSKWVGETEKNIDKILGEIYESDSVLLFDEADGLFSKRTQVNGSSDRFSNSVTNLLLSRLEHVDSLVILTTNHFENIDPAFHRRMQILEFKKPNFESRFKLWKTLIPKQVPLAGDIDFEYLATTFNKFTGGDIKKAIIKACYSKAMKLKSDKIVNQKDLTVASGDIGQVGSSDKIGFAI
ncbi:MAG: ATP-binding protein [Balneola sp.]